MAIKNKPAKKQKTAAIHPTNKNDVVTASNEEALRFPRGRFDDDTVTATSKKGVAKPKKSQ